MPIDPHPAAHLPRRRFLKLSAGGAAGAAGLNLVSPGRSAAGAIRTTRTTGEPAPAKNLIFMVSDGMSMGTLTLADMFRRHHEQRPSNWISLFARPGVRRGLYATHSADSLVTDSAASGSCWGCGQRVNNGTLNITPDGVQRLPLLVQAMQSGRKTGLVSTARITHATPASFVANMPRRDWEEPIGAQMLDRPVDVLLGGGAKFFKPERISERKDVALVTSRDELLRAAETPAPGGPGRLLGLFAPSHMPFELDRAQAVPTLAEMTRVALRRLAPAADGFVLQVEGGRVDHAAHSNDAASIVREQLAFDDAIAEVMTFVEGRDDTLVILTSDHGNANPGLTVYGAEAREGFGRLAGAIRSFEWIGQQMGATDPAGHATLLPKLVASGLGVELDDEERRILAAALEAKRVAPFREQSKFEPVLGGVLANHFGIGFVSGNHTADYVEVTALGPGSRALAPTGHNTDLHALVVNALGLAPGELLEDMKAPVAFPKPPKPD